MNNQGDSFSLIEDMLKGQIFYDLIYSPMGNKNDAGMQVKRYRCNKWRANVGTSRDALAFKHFFGKTPDTDTMLKLLSSNRG